MSLTRRGEAVLERFAYLLFSIVGLLAATDRHFGQGWTITLSVVVGMNFMALLTTFTDPRLNTSKKGDN